MLLFIMALPAIPVLLNSVCSINAMSISTEWPIRWANISIAVGAGAEIAAFFSVISVDYGTWTGIKFMITGAFMINLGYAILYISNRRKCECRNCVYTIGKHNSIKEC